MRISLNLATKPFADIGPRIKNLRIAMGALAIVALALGYGVYALDAKAKAAHAREHVLETQVDRINKERQGYQAMMRQPDNAATLTMAENLNHLFDEKAFSWTLAMEDLETVLPGGVQVTTLEPTRDKEGHITLHLRVLGPRDKSVQLIANLEHSRRFLSPRIAGESSESATGPNQRVEPVSASNRVNFDVLAEYVPAKPGERKAEKKASEAKTLSAEPASSAPHGNTLGPKPPGAARPPYTGAPRPHAPMQPAPGEPR